MQPVLLWFRRNLRLSDNAALIAAADSGCPVIPVYILDEQDIGGASRWWLHHSLADLSRRIRELGGELHLLRGVSSECLEQLARDTGATAVYCSRQYEPWAAQLEQQANHALSAQGVTLQRYPGCLLFQPEQALNKAGEPYRVFTPFWRRCQTLEVAQPLTTDLEAIDWFSDKAWGERLSDWSLEPKNPDWAAEWSNWWQPGSDGARARLRDFLENRLCNYSEGRNHPELDCTTRLSPHLHHGELSPRAVWHTAQLAAAGEPALENELEKFLSELAWREFSHHLLHHYPHLTDSAFQPKFSDFPWSGSGDKLRAWQRGETGYPMVDAGMRELWQTGYMHNRVRMIVASFLTKHLLVDWRRGAHWFWDTLLDADLANNSCGWQWVAGSGADAAPYFRIFNPVLQGQKFDADGVYTRRWVPELAGLPDRYLQRPWEAPAEVLEQAGVTLGTTYPAPIVEHKAARESALAAYASLQGSAPTR